MSAIPGSLDTDQQPPMTVPLRYFFVALAFLLSGAGLGVAMIFDAAPPFAGVAHVHLLLAGWVCLTIMGAMTQFVPVWSGVPIHSRTLANLQLVLVAVGLACFVLAILSGRFAWLPMFGAAMLAGFWVFVYNIGRTLLQLETYDVTERHFLFALACFLLLSILGVSLAANLDAGVLGSLPVSHGGVLGAHATLAVFGAVLTTIYGAIYQLGTMFTQTDLTAFDQRLQSVEELAHPIGVLALAGGRLFDLALLAAVGGLLILTAAVAVGVIIGHKLLTMQVERTPMHSRYAVVVGSLLCWVALTAPTWLDQPVSSATPLGGNGSFTLLVLGVVGFVVLGTLYHVIPFIIWVHEYSDLLGFEEVPMVDDLYDHRLAALDFWLVFTGLVALVGGELIGSRSLLIVGTVALALGVFVFAANMGLVVRRHSKQGFRRILFGRVQSVLPERTQSTQPQEK